MSDVRLVFRETAYDHMSRVARDARDLLGALNVNVDWLRSGFQDRVPAAQLLEGLVDIEACCERLNNLLEDALIGSRNNGLAVQRSSVGIGSVLASALKQVRSSAAAKQVSFLVATEAEVAAMLDRALLTRAMAKLMNRVIGEREAGSEIVISYGVERDQIAICFSQKGGPEGLESAADLAEEGSDLDFCRLVAEGHGGALSAGNGPILYSLSLPCVSARVA